MDRLVTANLTVAEIELQNKQVSIQDSTGKGGFLPVILLQVNTLPCGFTPRKVAYL